MKQKKEIQKEAEKEKDKLKIIVKDSMKLLIKKKLEANGLKKASGSILALLEGTLEYFYVKQLRELKTIARNNDEMVRVRNNYYELGGNESRVP